MCGFGDKYYKVSRYVNNRFVPCVVAGAAIKLLFAQNPLSKGRTKRVTCLNIETNVSVQYSSVNNCVRSLGLTIDKSSTIISDFIKPHKVYAGKYLISYVTKL